MKQDIEKIKKQLLAVIEKNLGRCGHKVFLFGSRAKGDAWDRSDIDVGIEGDKPIPSEIKLKIEEELNNLPTLYKFDLVDFKAVSDEFKKETLKNIKPLN